MLEAVFEHVQVAVFEHVQVAVFEHVQVELGASCAMP